jgi:hypothetical protein
MSGTAPGAIDSPAVEDKAMQYLGHRPGTPTGQRRLRYIKVPAAD